MTPSECHDAARLLAADTSLDELATILYKHGMWSMGTHRPRQSALLAMAAHACLHELRPCAAGCRRLVWPALGDVCEECWRREEHREEKEDTFPLLSEATARRLASQLLAKKDRPPLIFEEDPVTTAALAAAEARGRAAGLREAVEEADRRAALNHGPRREQAWASYDSMASWCRRKAIELERGGA